MKYTLTTVLDATCDLFGYSEADFEGFTKDDIIEYLGEEEQHELFKYMEGTI